jgi:hypothetical protein
MTHGQLPAYYQAYRKSRLWPSLLSTHCNPARRRTGCLRWRNILIRLNAIDGRAVAADMIDRTSAVGIVVGLRLRLTWVDSGQTVDLSQWPLWPYVRSRADRQLS